MYVISLESRCPLKLVSQSPLSLFFLLLASDDDDLVVEISFFVFTNRDG